MSLINVAAELALSGRKVLVVDFDLEAPGIGEFDLIKPSQPVNGVVEFVEDYLREGIVPDVSSYVYRSNIFEKTGGQLMVMPAGRLDNTYQDRFSAINWQDLYSEADGFAMFEDMRLQWQDKLECDYVFIDSRTGYTDIGGICTRQLPDAVCLIFAPNKQNLTGLTNVVKEIRAQQLLPALRHPRLHFVPSNVPNLDDDNELLSAALQRFRDQLHYDKPCAIIHHYNSFALLNEEVFTLRHPTTQLAAQYRFLANKIAQYNLRDRISVLEFLRAVIADYPNAGKDFTAQDIDNLLDKILKTLGSDPDVIYLVSRVKRISGDLDQCKELLDLAIAAGCMLPRAFLDRASFAERDSNNFAAWHDVQNALNSTTIAATSDIIMAIRMATRLSRFLGPEFSLEVFSSSIATSRLGIEDLLYVCSSISESKVGAEIVVRLLTTLFDTKNASLDDIDTKSVLLANSYIAIGELEEAISIYSDLHAHGTGHKLVAAFNLGMAFFWSTRRSESIPYFLECANIFATMGKDITPNKTQCESFVLWVLGDSESALQMLTTLKKSLTLPTFSRFFSCWRYYSVSLKQAEADLNDMTLLYKGEDLQPKFLSKFPEF